MSGRKSIALDCVNIDSYVWICCLLMNALSPQETVTPVSWYSDTMAGRVDCYTACSHTYSVCVYFSIVPKERRGLVSIKAGGSWELQHLKSFTERRYIVSSGVVVWDHIVNGNKMFRYKSWGTADSSNSCECENPRGSIHTDFAFRLLWHISQPLIHIEIVHLFRNPCVKYRVSWGLANILRDIR